MTKNIMNSQPDSCCSNICGKTCPLLKEQNELFKETIQEDDYCPQCETVCSKVSAMLEAAGFELDGEHDAILEALSTVEFVRIDHESRRAREIAERTLALIAKDPDFRIVRHFMEYVCAALDITGKELIDASIAVAKRP